MNPQWLPVSEIAVVTMSAQTQAPQTRATKCKRFFSRSPPRHLTAGCLATGHYCQGIFKIQAFFMTRCQWRRRHNESGEEVPRFTLNQLCLAKINSRLL